MKTKAVRFYGKCDLRLEEFELPAIKDDEILAHVISDSLCMSSYKAAIQGSDHKRVNKDINRNPVIIGHELCGEILEVGAKWKHRYKSGSRFCIQAAINDKSNPYAAPGYSFPYFGGDATHIIIPNVVMEHDCLLDYNNEAFFYGSLAEPMSCIRGAFHASYHTTAGSYVHNMGVKKGGSMAILAGVGPMGLGAIDYAIHSEKRPRLLVVTDIDTERLRRAESIYTPEKAVQCGVILIYVNTSGMEDVPAYLKSLNNGEGFDDVFVYTPVKEVVEQGDRILGKDGCLNFFAGPTNPSFSAELNFYDVHYNATHIVGTSGGNTDDMLESLKMIETGLIDPASMITHVGGLNCVVDATLNLPQIPGGKKLIYTNIDMELTAIADFEQKGINNPLFAALSEILKRNNDLWCVEAEKYLLSNAKKI